MDWNRTILRNPSLIANAGVILVPGNNSVIEDLAIFSDGGTAGTSAPIGSFQSAVPPQKPFNNVFVRNVRLVGETDCFYADQGIGCSITFDSCLFESKWDCVAFMNSARHDFTFINSRLISRGPATVNYPRTARNINALAGKATFISCDISCSNGVDTTYAVELRTPDSKLVFVNTRIITSSSTGVVYDIANLAPGRAEVFGGFVDQKKVIGPVVFHSVGLV